MKQISTLLIFCCLNTATWAQVISFAPNTLFFTAASGAYAGNLTTTISGTGLTPASGYVTVTAPIKFEVSTSASAVGFSVDLPYSGGTLPPTTLYIGYALPNDGPGGWNELAASGGGVSAATRCMCVYTTSCPCEPSAVPAAPNETAIKIEPNPTYDNLTVTVGEVVRRIIITNIMGQELLDHVYNAEKVQVIVSDLPAGIYFARINGTAVRKFVKQ